MSFACLKGLETCEGRLSFKKLCIAVKAMRLFLFQDGLKAEMEHWFSLSVLGLPEAAWDHCFARVKC